MFCSYALMQRALHSITSRILIRSAAHVFCITCLILPIYMERRERCRWYRSCMYCRLSALVGPRKPAGPYICMYDDYQVTMHLSIKFSMYGESMIWNSKVGKRA